MRNDKDNLIVNLSLDFAVEIIDFCEELQSNRQFVISNQLLKSGTSIGANVREAQNSESPADFIHKMKIAAKEADETEYWLELCKRSDHYPYNKKLEDQLLSIIKVLSKIISTSKKKEQLR